MQGDLHPRERLRESLTKIGHIIPRYPPSVVGHLEKRLLELRQKIGRLPEDEVLDLNVDSSIWRFF